MLLACGPIASLSTLPSVLSRKSVSGSDLGTAADRGTVRRVDAEYFDRWFADIGRSAAMPRLFGEALGVPDEVGPANLVPLDGLREVAALLALEPGDVLVDLACGRGGPGMWLARELDVDLIGVDFSEQAVTQAMARRSLFGLEQRARFEVGGLDATGLPAGSAAAVVCIDAFQFAPDADRSAAEMRRLLCPGGRVALTTWEALDPDGADGPEPLRGFDPAASLASAGFVDVRREERPEWYARERALWEKLVELDVGDDPAMKSVREEAEETLPIFDQRRRVLVSASAP